VQQQLKSENPLDRIGTLFDLRDLIEGSDKRLADAAMQALERLAQDDSRTVAARAQHLLDDEKAKPRSAGRAARRRATSIEAEAAPIAPGPEPIAPETIAQPVPAAITPREPMPAPLPAAASPGASAQDIVGSGIPAPTARIWSESSADMPWSIRRAASRAVIGSFVWVALQLVWLLVSYYWFHVDLSISGQQFLESAVAIAFYTPLVITIAEKLVPALRVPVGAAYRRVGANRWLASAILGAGAGLTVGLVVQGSYGYLGFELPFCAAIGFVIAEAVVGRRFRGNREGPSLAA
jgi:hypothetical protein